MTEFLQILLGGVLVGATYALIALGIYLVYRVTGVVNLAQGGFAVAGALLAWWIASPGGASQTGMPVWVAVPGAVLATTALGTALGAVTFVPGLSRLSNGNMLMLSAGMLTMIEGVLLAGWGSQPYVLAPFNAGRPAMLAGISLPLQGIWVLAATAVVTVGIWLLLTRTGTGRALRACAENPAAARLVGVSVPAVTLTGFALATAIGAVAGVVVAPTTSLEFDTGRLFTVSGFIAVVLGGLGSFSGAVAGAMLLGVVQQLATAYVSSLFSNAVALVLLLAVLVAAPQGLLRAGVARRADVREAGRGAARIARVPGRIGWPLAGLALAGALVLPSVVSASVLSGLAISAILFLALIGLDVAMGYAGQVNLGQAGFMAVGGYTAGYIAINADMEPIVGVLAAIVLAVACAMLLSLVTARLRGFYLALATLAFGLLVDSLAVGLIDITGGPSGLVGIPGFTLGGLDFDAPDRMYYLAVGLDVAALLLLGGAMRTGFGRALRAIRTDQLAAAALGVDVNRAKMTALAIGAALAALSGSLYAFFFHFLSPEMVGTPRSLELVAMLVIGGEGTLVGPVIGAVVLTLLPTVVQPLAVWKTFATGALLVLCFLRLPQGIWGAAAGWLGRRVPA